MYQIIDAETNYLIEEMARPMWVKQQERVDIPIKANNYEEADGVVLSDQTTTLGIEGRNMENYTPLVRIVEVSSDPVVFAEIEAMKAQINAVQNGVTEVYNVQTIGAVPKADLDTAYKEGVNSYAE